jgi:hypothetical protein
MNNSIKRKLERENTNNNNNNNNNTNVNNNNVVVNSPNILRRQLPAIPEQNVYTEIT